MEERRAGDRRSGPSKVHFPERRTGFDRRSNRWSDGLARDLRDAPVLLAAVLALFVTLNLADLAITQVLVGRGAVELNPIMRWALSVDTAWMLKIGATIGVAGALWHYRRYRLVLLTAPAVTLLMAVVVAYQAAGLLIRV